MTNREIELIIAEVIQEMTTINQRTVTTKIPTRINALLRLQQFNHHPVDPISMSPSKGMETKTVDATTHIYMQTAEVTSRSGEDDNQPKEE